MSEASGRLEAVINAREGQLGPLGTRQIREAAIAYAAAVATMAREQAATRAEVWAAQCAQDHDGDDLAREALELAAVIRTELGVTSTYRDRVLDEAVILIDLLLRRDGERPGWYEALHQADAAIRERKDQQPNRPPRPGSAQGESKSE